MFYKRKASKDGYSYICKTCNKEHMKRYRKENKDYISKYNKLYKSKNKEVIAESWGKYYKKNKDKLSESKKQYYKDNKDRCREYNKLYYKNNKEYFINHHKKYYKENREELIEYTRRYYQENKEKVSQYQKQCRENNREKFNERNRKWCRKNPEKIKARGQRRKAKKIGLIATLTDKQWEQIKQYFNNRCAYCGKELDLQQDHFIPLSKGGEYTINNIIPACRSCNASKKDKLFSEWYPKYRYYSKKREKTILNFLNHEKDEN